MVSFLKNLTYVVLMCDTLISFSHIYVRAHLIKMGYIYGWNNLWKDLECLGKMLCMIGVNFFNYKFLTQ